MQVPSTHAHVEHNVAIPKKRNLTKLQVTVTLVALAALAGAVCSTACGNLVVTAVCAAVLTVAAIIGLVLLGINIHDSKNKTKLDKPTSLETPQPPKPTVIDPTVLTRVQEQNNSPQNKKFLDLSIMNQVVDQAPPFLNYGIKTDHISDLVLTGLSYRPANLFLKALLGPLCKEGKEPTTMPGEGLFKHKLEHAKIANFIVEQAKTDQIVSFSSKTAPENIRVRSRTGEEKFVPSSDIFGDREYQISYEEVQKTLESQRIYVSQLLPLDFYSGLKAAMKKDAIVVLPGHDSNPYLLRELRDSKNKNAVSEFLTEATKNPQKFGFAKAEDFEILMDLTIYQIGSMVVKSEDYHIFMDENGRILERKVGDNDAIRLLNACGIRGLGAKKTNASANQVIMTETFKTALTAAESGIVLFPAVGMGVWGGNPEIYWTAFLDAVIASDDNFDAIYVNPGHAPTPKHWTENAGKKGDELEKYLAAYKTKYAHDSAMMDKLNKIQNLYEKKTDLVQLGHHLKKAFPDKIVSLFNASDPDVTLGYHVGEYTNNMPHTNTTEENYTAMGSNGICFETITGVHENPTRLFQVVEADNHVFAISKAMILAG